MRLMPPSWTSSQKSPRASSPLNLSFRPLRKSLNGWHEGVGAAMLKRRIASMVRLARGYDLLPTLFSTRSRVRTPSSFTAASTLNLPSTTPCSTSSSDVGGGMSADTVAKAPPSAAVPSWSPKNPEARFLSRASSSLAPSATCSCGRFASALTSCVLNRRLNADMAAGAEAGRWESGGSRTACTSLSDSGSSGSLGPSMSSSPSCLSATLPRV
mmetsp:Transcript_37217/g.82782  ORF Transcript_37217/g.82782 Transcript_37217/m.82782 type:complete len:213 (+) Transcript_37217:533-1171(+)